MGKPGVTVKKKVSDEVTNKNTLDKIQYNGFQFLLCSSVFTLKNIL